MNIEKNPPHSLLMIISLLFSACAALLQGPLGATEIVAGPLDHLGSVQQHRIHFIVTPIVSNALSTLEIESRLVKYVADLNTLFAHQTIRRIIFDPTLDITYASDWPNEPIELHSPLLFDRDYDINVVLGFGINGHTSISMDQSKATHIVWRGTGLLDRDNPISSIPYISGLDYYWSQVVTLAHEILHGTGAGWPEYYVLDSKPDDTGVLPHIILYADRSTMSLIFPNNAYWQEHTDFWSDPLLITERGTASIDDRLQRTRLAELTVAQANSRRRRGVFFDELAVALALNQTRIRVTEPNGVTPVAGASVRVWVGQYMYSRPMIELSQGTTDTEGQFEFAWSPNPGGTDAEGVMLLVKVFPANPALSPAGMWLNSNDAVEEFLLRDQTQMTIGLALESPMPRPSLNQINTFQSTEDAPFVLSHAALLAASDATDPQGLPIQFRIERFATGKLTKNGQPVTTHATLLGPGESLVWTPPAHRHGAHFPALVVRAHNGFSSSAKAIGVRVTLLPAPDAPILRDQSASLIEDTFVDLEADADDPDGSVPMLVIATQPQHGQVSVLRSANYSTFHYVPNADFNGVDTFTYIAQGASAVSAPASVTLTITPVNDPPTMANAIVSFAAAEDQAQTQTVSALLAAAGARSPDGRQIFMKVTALHSGVLTRDGASVALNTLLTGNAVLKWQPALNSMGQQSAFSFLVSDGLANSATTSQLLTQLTSVNDAPTFVMPATSSINEDSTVCIALSNVGPGGGGDEANQFLSFSMLTSNYALVPNAQPQLSISGSGANRCLNVTPTKNAFGTATITLTLSDNGGGISHLLSQNIIITVTAVNDPPTYVSGSGTFTSTGISSWARLFPALSLIDVDQGDSIVCRFSGGLPSNVEIVTGSGTHALVSGSTYYPLATFKTFWIVKRNIFSGGAETHDIICKDQSGAVTAPVSYTVVAS
jgi:hypothetical protein